MFEKRKFDIYFIREEKGQKLYLITDSEEEVFVDYLLPEREARSMLRLVEQAYRQGVLDMKEDIIKKINDVN
jgi:hypothetical protein